MSQLSSYSTIVQFNMRIHPQCSITNSNIVIVKWHSIFVHIMHVVIPTQCTDADVKVVLKIDCNLQIQSMQLHDILQSLECYLKLPL